MTEGKTLEQIKKQLEDIFSTDEWRGTLTRSEWVRLHIRQAKKTLVEWFGDDITFEEERLDGDDPGFDYSVKFRPTADYTIEIDLKDFE